MELRLAVEGEARRRKHERRLVAWHGALVANALGARVTVGELMGESEPEPIFFSMEEFRAHMRKKVAAREMKGVAGG